MNIQWLLKAVVLPCAFGLAQPLFAADCTVSPDSQNVLGRLGVTRAAGCFGDSNDTDALSVKVMKIQRCDASTSDDVAALRSQLASASSEVETEAASLAATAASDWRPPLGNLQHELADSTNELKDLRSIPRPTYWTWSGSGEALQQLNGRFLISYAPIVQARCPGGQPPGQQGACASAVDTAVRVIRVVNLTHYLHQCAGTPRINILTKRLSELDAEWDRYFFKTRSQYVWELYVNSARFDSQMKREGKREKLVDPPVDQVILAHSGVAFEYVGGAARHDKSYQPILIADLVGYNRFGWPARRDGSPSRIPPLGASIVASYSPENVGKHFGYGVMFHAYNTYSFGVTRRDTGAGTDTTYLLSADLMRIVLSPSSEWIKKFRGEGAPGSVDGK